MLPLRRFARWRPGALPSGACAISSEARTPAPAQPASASVIEERSSAATAGREVMETMGALLGEESDKVRERDNQRITLNGYSVRAFRENSFLQPTDLSRASRTYVSPPSLPPHLGPGAAASHARDVFHRLAIDPVWEYKNGTLLGGFQSDMGMIKPRKETGLTWRSQRKVRRAIKRAKMMGLIPLFSLPGAVSRRNTSNPSSFAVKNRGKSANRDKGV